jgi:hypothetical protein
VAVFSCVMAPWLCARWRPAPMQVASARCRAVPSRVEVQAAHAVAIDVEYIHVRVVGKDSIYKKYQVPGEVCLVDAEGEPIVYTKVDAVSEIGLLDGDELCHDGGHSLDDVQGMPLLSEIRGVLVERMDGRLVVGHNLAKDLQKLGITERMVPPSMRRDTMGFAALQNEKGHGRSLAELSETKLGKTIQRDRRHCAAEDARATMELYLRFCHYDESLMSYDDLVEYQVSKLLSKRINE